MNETPFFMTRMGQRYYEHTMPELVRQLERLNKLLERFVRVQEQQPQEDDGND